MTSPGEVNSSLRGLILRALFQDAKSSLTKHKRCFMEVSYGTSQTSKLELLQKKVNGL